MCLFSKNRFSLHVCYLINLRITLIIRMVFFAYTYDVHCSAFIHMSCFHFNLFQYLSHTHLPKTLASLLFTQNNQQKWCVLVYRPLSAACYPYFVTYCKHYSNSCPRWLIYYHTWCHTLRSFQQKLFVRMIESHHIFTDCWGWGCLITEALITAAICRTGLLSFLFSDDFRYH